MESGRPPDESYAEQRSTANAPPAMPALHVLLVSPPTDSARIDELLATGAVVLLASRIEHVRFWLAGDLVQKTLPESVNPHDAIIRIDHLMIDPREHRAFWRGNLLPLSERELSILKTLAEEPRRAWSFRELIGAVWSSAYYGDKTLVKVAIQHLRKKLRDAGVTVEIESVRGYGFRLTSV